MPNTTTFGEELFGEIWSGSIENPSDLRGEFALIRAEPGSVRVLRDPLGVIPVYYAQYNRRLFVSTALLPLATRMRELGLNLNLNRRYFACLWWQSYFLMDESPFCEIRRLPPGHELTIKNDVAETRAYVALNLLLSMKTEESAVEELRTLLKLSINHRLKAMPSILLSGGFDSTLLATLAGPKAEFDCLAFSGEGPDHHSRLQDLLGLLKGKTFITNYHSDDSDYLDNDPNLLVHYSPSLYIFRRLIHAGRTRGRSVFWSGLGGDDLFTQPEIYLSSLLRRGWLKAWASQLRPPWNSSLRSSLFPLAPISIFARTPSSHSRKYNPFLMPSECGTLAEEMREHHIKVRSLSKDAYQRNLAAKFTISGMLAFAFEQEQELAQFYGARLSYPYLDYDLLSAVLKLGPEHHLADFRNKGLLRKVASILMPKELTELTQTQDYYQMIRKTIEAQSQVFYLRRETLQAAGLALTNLVNPSLEEILLLNYTFKIHSFSGGADEKERKGEAEKEI